MNARWMRAGTIALAASLWLSGCETSASFDHKQREKTAEKAAVSIPLARNLVGEPCRAEPRGKGSIEEAENKAFDVFCGTWEQPSGRIVAVSGDRIGLIGPTPELWATKSWWRQQLDQRVSCAEPQPTAVLDGLRAVSLDCQLRRGGWPYVAFVAKDGDTMFMADGIPPTQAALESALRRVLDPNASAKAATTDEGSRSAAIVALEARLGKSGGAFSTNDLAAYEDLMRLGQLYNSAKDFKDAENAYRKALEIHERVLGLNNPETGTALIALALEVSNQGRFDEADALFNRAEPLVKTSSDASDYARYLSYVALHAANRRDHETALKFARQATEEREKQVKREQERKEQQKQKSGGVMQTLGGGGGGLRSSSISEAEIAQSKYVEAAMLLRLGQLAEAETVARNAAGILRATPKAPEHWMAEVEFVLAEILAAAKRFDESETLVRDGIRTRQRLFGNARPTALGYMQLGDLYIARSQPANALLAYRHGVQLIRETETSSAGVTLNLDRLAPYLYALLKEAEAKPAEATVLYAEMFEASQLVREGVTSQTIAKTAARLAAGDNKVGELVRALQEAERVRDESSFALSAAKGLEGENRDVVREQELTTKRDNAVAKVTELEQQIQAAFPGYAQLVSSKPIAVSDIQKQLRAGEALLQFAIGTEYSFGFLITSAGLRPFQLGMNRAEIDRSVSDLRKAFIVERGNLESFDLALSHRLYRAILAPAAAQLKDVRHLVAIPSGSLLAYPLGLLVTEDPGSGRGQSADSHAAWLVRQLAVSVTPTARAFIDLRAVGAAARAPLPFIGFGNPDYRRTSLPPETPPPVPPASSSGVQAAAKPGVQPAAARMDTVAPSAGPAGALQPAPKPVPVPAVQEEQTPALQTRGVEPDWLRVRAAGGSQYDLVAELCKHGSTKSALLNQLAPLPETEDELLRVANILGASASSVVTGGNATVTAVKQRDLTQYRVIYFALHGLLPGELRCEAEPSLAMSVPYRISPQDSGLLTASEIAELRLNADLVVLSACNTGGSEGKLGGEALSGLARSFFFAGARTLLVTHWQVPSVATVELTTGIFRRLGGNATMGGATALQQAQVDLIGNPATAHPVFWGAFMLVGDGGGRS